MELYRHEERVGWAVDQYKRDRPITCQKCRHCDVDACWCAVLNRRVIVERLRNCAKFEAIER